MESIEFQSTHPVWGATVARKLRTEPPTDFNPRTPCGVRPSNNSGWTDFNGFQSTHPVWGATNKHSTLVADKEFQSTHPVWGATWDFPGLVAVKCYFNPRTPCGVRPAAPYPNFTVLFVISIHAPRVGCDMLNFFKTSAFVKNFNPRTPCGVRLPWEVLADLGDLHFNPRTPCGVRRFQM